MSKQTEAAYHYIKQRIIDGSYMPYQKLTEAHLAETIGVSRNTIKKALLKLEQEKLVTIEENKGASIKSFTLEEVMNYLDIRAVLEGLVAKSIAKNISSTELEKMNIILQEMAIRLEDKKYDEYADLNKDFHSVIYKATKNNQAVELLDMIKTQLKRFQFRIILVQGRVQESYKEHIKVYEALAAHNELEAEEALKNHVFNIRRTISENYHLFL